MARNPSGYSETPKTIQPTTTIAMTSDDSSSHARRDHGRRGAPCHRRSTGANTIAPEASPNHHVNQVRQYAAQSSTPKIESAVTPVVALTAVLTSPPNRTKAKMFRDS